MQRNNAGMRNLFVPSVLPRPLISGVTLAAIAVAMMVIGFYGSSANAMSWESAWPKTDFSKKAVDLGEIRSGGPGKDGIPAIDKPRFVPTKDAVAEKRYVGNEPVIGLEINGDIRAYPLQLLIWHEIVNDMVGGVPVTVTYCPLCNSSIVFDRRVDGQVLDFGTTGNLRKSDMVMYDRQTESWWQQFLGEAIVGKMMGTRLKALPSRVESFARFAARAPGGKVLVPTGDVGRPYGTNPYDGYDSASRPFLYQGDLPKGIAPMAYVLAIGDEAWSLDLIRRERRIEKGDLIITWEAGQASALDASDIFAGRDIGNIVVQRKTAAGLVDEVHDLTFAFVFHAFVKGGTLNK